MKLEKKHIHSSVFCWFLLHLRSLGGGSVLFAVARVGWWNLITIANTIAICTSTSLRRNLTHRLLIWFHFNYLSSGKMVCGNKGKWRKENMRSKCGVLVRLVGWLVGRRLLVVGWFSFRRLGFYPTLVFMIPFATS